MDKKNTLNLQTLSEWKNDALACDQTEWKYDEGNWNVESGERFDICFPSEPYGEGDCIYGKWVERLNGLQWRATNGQHIANACPKNFIALIDEVLELRKLLADN